MSHRIEVSPLTVHIGAEIRGVKLTEPLDEETFAAILDAFHRHHVLFLRDHQAVGPEALLDFAARFGPISEPHPTFKRHPESSKISVIASSPNHSPGTDGWHADTTFWPNPPLGTVLKAVTLPEVGGDTLWANMHAVHESLPASTRDRIAGLTAHHHLYNPDCKSLRRVFDAIERENDPERVRRQEELKMLPGASHPVVTLHPVTGRKTLFVNSMYTRHIEGISREESQRLLAELFEAVTCPDYQCRFRWSEGTIAVWDNRCTQHYATADYWPRHRVMHRIMLEGSAPAAASARG